MVTRLLLLTNSKVCILNSHEAICIPHIWLSSGYRESSIMQENFRRSLKQMAGMVYQYHQYYTIYYTTYSTLYSNYKTLQLKA